MMVQDSRAKRRRGACASPFRPRGGPKVAGGRSATQREPCYSCSCPAAQLPFLPALPFRSSRAPHLCIHTTPLTTSTRTKSSSTSPSTRAGPLDLAIHLQCSNELTQKKTGEKSRSAPMWVSNSSGLSRPPQCSLPLTVATPFASQYQRHSAAKGKEGRPCMQQ